MAGRVAMVLRLSRRVMSTPAEVPGWHRRRSSPAIATLRRRDGGRKGVMAAHELRAPGDVLRHLRRARDHADRCYTEPLDLGELAALACLSKYHFARLFKATYGLTPMEYVSQRRIERA